MKKYKKVEFLTKLGKINFKYLTENLAFDNSFSLEDTKLAENIIESLKNTNTVPFEWTPQEEEFIKNEPKSKWLKYLTYRYKLKKYPKQHIVSDFPFYVLVEPVSSCNLRCVMCYQTDKTFTRKPYMGLMKMELYKNIIDQLVEGETRALTMASRGEPSMHPKFGEMLEYASGKFYDFKINTNATRLNENMCHEILSSGVNVLTFSIDAHEKKLYEEIRVRGKFDEVLANIIRFKEIRDKYYPRSKISTRVSGVMFREDQDLNGFLKFWEKIVDHVVIVGIENRWDTYNLPIDYDYKKSCDYLWDRIHIWFDGTCNPCDVDYKSKLSPGNVCEQSVSSIWKSEAMQRLRQAHIEGLRCNFQPCDRCGVS